MDNRFISRLHPLAAARKSIHNTVPSEMHRSPNTIRRCTTKITSDEQRAKAREHQKRWREKLKSDVAKSAEYREMQRERTRYLLRYYGWIQLWILYNIGFVLLLLECGRKRWESTKLRDLERSAENIKNSVKNGGTSWHQSRGERKGNSIISSGGRIKRRWIVILQTVKKQIIGNHISHTTKQCQKITQGRLKLPPLRQPLIIIL